MPTDDFWAATYPLFEDERVEALEWSFDMAWSGAKIDDWCSELIDKFSAQNNLTGHGVNLSVLSAQFSEKQNQWLKNARVEFQKHKYLHASEHFGFSEAGSFSQGAPLAVPLNKASLQAGTDNLKRYADATGCSVGLENLAFAFCIEDVKRQGEFLDKLLDPVDGFVVLDLHNLYCQVENFLVSGDELLASYPLEKVREMHVSGGSWSPSISGKREAVRRDTHDGPVPIEVFELTAKAVNLCENLQFIFLERLGNTMFDFESQSQFRDDFNTLEQLRTLCYA